MDRRGMMRFRDNFIHTSTGRIFYCDRYVLFDDKCHMVECQERMICGIDYGAVLELYDSLSGRFELSVVNCGYLYYGYKQDRPYAIPDGELERIESFPIWSKVLEKDWVNADSDSVVHEWKLDFVSTIKALLNTSGEEYKIADELIKAGSVGKTLSGNIRDYAMEDYIPF